MTLQRQQATGRGTLQAPLLEMPPSCVTYVPTTADPMLVHVLHAPPLERPKIAAPPVDEAPADEVLESSQAPLAGIGVAEWARRYSAAWHMCEPTNCALQATCIPIRPVMAAGALVTPTNVVFGAPLQHASDRGTLQAPLLEIPPSGVTYDPTTADPRLVQVLHAAPFDRPKPGADPVVDEPSNAVLESIHAPPAGTGVIEFERRYSEAWQR